MRTIKKCFILVFAVSILMLLMTGCGKKQDQDFFDNVEDQIHTEIENSATQKESAEMILEAISCGQKILSSERNILPPSKPFMGSKLSAPKNSEEAIILSIN